MDVYEAIKNAMKTDYAVESSGERINAYDAGAFYLEGYESRDKEIENIKIKAQIEAYEDAMRIYHHSYPLTIMRDKITALKRSMEE